MIPGQPDLMSGGPACQPFTTIGKRLSLRDTRGRLVKDFTRLVRDVRPKFFLMENVRGLLSASTDDYPQKSPGSVMESLLRDFRESGYSCSWALLNSADYGVPQIRKRVFIVGNRLGIQFCFPKPTHSPAGKRKWRTLRQALFGIGKMESLCESYPPSTKEYFYHIPAGHNWRSLPHRLQEAAMGKAIYAVDSGRTGFFRRLSFDRPCPTLLCDPLTKACSVCHPTEIRPLSISEYARVQQFPDSWEFCGSLSKKYALIANAVPVGLSKAIGRAIAKNLRSKTNSPMKNGQSKCARVGNENDKARVAEIQPI